MNDQGAHADGGPGQWMACDCCVHQRGEGDQARCGNPKALANGGTGLMATYTSSTAIMTTRGRYGGRRCTTITFRHFRRCNGLEYKATEPLQQEDAC